MAPSEPAEGYVVIARILGAHGVRGDLKVHRLAPESCFRKGAPVLVSGRALEIEWLRPAGKGDLLKLTGIDDRSAAADLRGEFVQMREDELEPLPEGDYYRFQLVGLAVQTSDGRELGRVVDIMETGSADVYVVVGPLGEVLLPATEEVITDIDLAARTMTIEPMPGLLPE